MTWLTNSVYAVVIVVGASVAVVGALSGTLFPLLHATVTIPGDLSSDFGALVDTLIIFVGTMTALFYFHYQARANSGAGPGQSRLGRGFPPYWQSFHRNGIGRYLRLDHLEQPDDPQRTRQLSVSVWRRMSERRIHSILAADFGSVHTRALLFDKVDGRYQLVASGSGRTTIGSPTDDVQVGLATILREMSEATGRRFFDQAGGIIRPEQADRVGVDYFLTTSSAGPSLRAALVGLYPQVSIRAARRAIAPFYLDAVAEVHLEDGLSARGRLNRIIHSRPQIIIITGGADGGARTVLLEMLALVREAVSLMPQGSKPAVLYAGNSSLTASVREMLSQQVEVLMAPNIRQQGRDTLEPAQSELGRYFDGVKRHSRGFQRIALASDSGIVPTARPIETMTAFFSRLRRARCVDDRRRQRANDAVAGAKGPSSDRHSQ